MAEAGEYRARLAGGAALRLLEGLGEARVLAVFRRSFYIADAEGRLACIGPAELGPGPLNLVCELPADFSAEGFSLVPGSIVWRDADILWFGKRLRIDVGAVEAWNPPLVTQPRELAQGLAQLAAVAGAAGRQDGFAPLILPLATSSFPRKRESSDPWAPAFAGATAEELGRNGIDVALIRAASPGISALAAWLCEADGEPPRIVASLLGLGPGLTPSGDDFLGGLLIALRAFGRGAVADRLAVLLLPAAREATSAISAAHLACAAEGEGSAALHELLAALASADGPRLDAAFAALAAIGHSSGLDMVAGVALAASSLRG